MRKIKIAICTLIAMICSMSISMPLSASATYDSCDVNHDGVVSLTDVVAVNLFLLGTHYYTNYNQLDANNSHIIDYADTKCILCKLIDASYSCCFIRQYGNGFHQPVTMPPVVEDPPVLDESTTQTDDRWYVGYSYIDEAPISRYKLSVNTTALNTRESGVSGLIDEIDDRVVSHGNENYGIVAIGNSSNYYGTGFIVGAHEIATAAHCVHNNGQIITDIKIATYDNSGAPTGNELEVAEIHIPEDYGSTRDYTGPCSQLDYALITVTDDLTGYVHFSIGNCYNMSSTEAGSIPVHVTGQPNNTYPSSSPPGPPNSNDILYTDFGSVYGINATGGLCHTVDVTAGQSGAPIYTITRQTYNNNFTYIYTALAISTGINPNTYNFGTRLTKYHKMFYNNNTYASYQ